MRTRDGRVKILDEASPGAKYAAKSARAPATMVMRLPEPRAQLRGSNLHARLDMFSFSDVATIEIGNAAIPLESEPSVALALRASVFTQQLSGEAMSTGSRSLFVTARLVLE